MDGRGPGSPTHSSDNLSLQAILILEASSNVANAALAISYHIGDLANVVEHAATNEEENQDHGESRPDTAAGDDRARVGPGGNGSSSSNKHGGNGDGPAHPVDWPLYRRVRPVREVLGKPRVG